MSVLRTKGCGIPAIFLSPGYFCVVIAAGIAMTVCAAMAAYTAVDIYIYCNIEKEESYLPHKAYKNS